jgi:hypothetical protein
MKKFIGIFMTLFGLLGLILAILIIRDDLIFNAIIKIPKLISNELAVTEHYQTIGILSGLLLNFFTSLIFIFFGIKLSLKKKVR